MINYDYICENCGYELKDVLQSIRDNPFTHCDKCNQESLSRVIFGGRGVFIENVSTIGQLADKNARDMGHYKRSEAETKLKETKAKSKESIHGKHATASKGEINKMSSDQKQNYIMKGK